VWWAGLSSRKLPFIQHVYRQLRKGIQSTTMPVWVQDGTQMDTILLLGQRGEPATLPHFKHGSWHKV